MDNSDLQPLITSLLQVRPWLTPQQAENVAKEVLRTIDRCNLEGKDPANIKLAIRGGRKPTVGLALKKYRKQAGFTPEQVATELECSVSTLLRLESGVTTPRVSTVSQLLKIYGVDATTAEALLQQTRDEWLLANQVAEQRRRATIATKAQS